MRLLTAFLPLFLLLAPAFPAKAQTLHVALREDGDILDPTLATTYVGRIVFAGLCDKLFDIDEKLQIVPQLATGYEWSDGKTLILHLRPNVQFQDGEPFDAAAVKYGLERHLTMQGSFRRAELSAIDHIEVVDPMTVRIVLKNPSGPFLSQLTDRAGMIVAPKAAQAEGKDFGLHPVCNGPFKFVERVPQDRIVLEKFPGYWNASAIHFDKVIYQPIVDSQVEIANLHTGTIDIAERVLPTDVAAVKADKNLRIVTSPALGYQYIIFNVGNSDKAKSPIGQNALLRQAFEAAIDRQAINEVVYNGMYVPDAQGVSPASPMHLKGFDPAPRDIEKAKALVKQSGVPTPIQVEMMVPNSPDFAQAAEVIQAMVKDAGFDVKIRLTEFASSLSAAAQGDFQAYMLMWSGRVDPDGNLYAFLHGGSAGNYGRYANPVADAGLDTARNSTDLATRIDAYTKTMTQMRTDVPVIFLDHPVNIVGMSAKVRGFRSVPDGMIRLQGLSLTP